MSEYSCYTARLYLHTLKRSIHFPEGIKCTLDTLSTHKKIWRRLVKEQRKARCWTLQWVTKLYPSLPLEEAHSLDLGSRERLADILISQKLRSVKLDMDMSMEIGRGHLSGMCTWNLKANISFLALLPKLDRNPDFKLNLIREKGIGIETVLLALRGRRTMTIWRSVRLRHFCLKENSWKELVVKVSTIIEKNGRISYFLNWVDEEETFGDLNICRTDCKDGRLNCMWKLCLDTNVNI